MNKTIAIVVLLATSSATFAQPVQKKLIATGWDNPTPAQLRRDLAMMEKQPFDGVIIHIPAQGPGAPKGSSIFGSAFGDKPWKEEWFSQPIDDLKAVADAKPARLTDLFAIINANPGNVDFFDDAGWKQIAEHWRLAARVAKRGHLKGLLFDPEPYAQPWSAFSYRAQPQCAQHSFGEYFAKSRQRGREVMKAIAGEYPDMTLMTYFMLSVNANAIGTSDPKRALAASGYGLYSPFIDGWLDAIPSAMTLVDGCESAYLYNRTHAFEHAATIIKIAAQDLVSPENRAKYRAQVQASYGIYVDAYANPKGSPWYIDGGSQPRVHRLEANVADALRCADEYVWIYGEKGTWWADNATTSKGEYPAWRVVLPGCEEALTFARNPRASAIDLLDRLRKENKLQNLLQNGDFSQSAAKGSVANWHEWQDEKRPRGNIAVDNGAAKLAGVAAGCLLQSIPAEAGQRYVIRGRVRYIGAEPHIRIRWNDARRSWIHEDLDVIAYPAAAAEHDAQQWQPIFETFVVPEGAAYLLVLLNVSHQTSNDAAWFDDVELYRIR